MIAKLRGVVDTIDSDSAVVDVGGVGYLVFCSAKTLGRMQRGEGIVLVIETHVREDHIHLYGFHDQGEREWFRLLNTVQGVGAKAALAILGVFDAEQLVTAVMAQDAPMIRRAPGIGPKLAARIVNELKGKVGDLVGLGAAGQPAGRGREGVRPATATTADAVSALVNLGYGASEAMRAVAATAHELGDEATIERLIRGGLAALAPKDVRA